MKNGFKDVYFQYYVMPNAFGEFSSFLDLYNETFVYWKKFWTSVFIDLGTNEIPSGDTFSRQNIIVAIVDTGRSAIAGMHLYSFFDLSTEVARQSSYFDHLEPSDTIEKLVNENIKSVMSMEYLTVDPKYRKSNLGYSLSKVILGLGYRLMSELPVDAMIAPCRCDVKVDKSVEEFGGITIGDRYIMHDVPVHTMIVPRSRIRVHPDLKVASEINKLWRDRIDYRTQGQQILRAAS